MVLDEITHQVLLAWNFRQSFPEGSASGGYPQAVVAVVVINGVVGPYYIYEFHQNHLEWRRTEAAGIFKFSS